MSRQLDILALEPFFGGPRRAMLQAIARCSRHRWTLLKLPARRIERRLLVAATWFAETIARREIAPADVLFTSEAMNLAELLRLAPRMARCPAVVYFHDNQLPDPHAHRRDTPADLVNLTTAMAATEIWFNSLYNLRTFLSRATGMVARHPELQTRSPLRDLTGKAQLVAPPVDLMLMHEVAEALRPEAAGAGGEGERHPRSVVLDARGADHDLVSAVLERLGRWPTATRVTVIGRARSLRLPAVKDLTLLSDRDEVGQFRALLGSRAVLTVGAAAGSDDLAVRALAAGCHPVLPADGAYPELIPQALHDYCLHDGTADGMVAQLSAAWSMGDGGGRPLEFDALVRGALEQFDAIRACKAIDDRLEALAIGHSVPAAARSQA